MVAGPGPHRRQYLHEKDAPAEWTGNGGADFQRYVRFSRLVHVARARVVLDDLRFHLRRRLESQRVGLCNRHDGEARARRADAAHRGPAAFPRFGQAAAGARHAVGLLRVFAIPDYLVRQSSGRDRLLPRAHTNSLGRAYHRDRNTSFRRAVSVPPIAWTETRSRQTGHGRAVDTRYARSGPAVGARTGIQDSTLDLTGRVCARWFWWFVAGILYVAIGQTPVDSD